MKYEYKYKFWKDFQNYLFHLFSWFGLCIFRMTTKRQRVDWRLSSIAIICLTIIQICAMYHGINGTLRTVIVSVIALIVGVQLPQIKSK